MADRVRLEVRERETRGSRDSRRLRKQGLIPGVIYGGGSDPRAISVQERDLRRALGGSGGLNTILDVVFDGGRPQPAVLKDYQQDPLRGYVTHVDLQQVRLDQPIQATIVVHLVGEAAGDKEGGVLTQVAREVNVEALPMELPEGLEVDVSALHIGDSLRLADVAAPEGVTFLDDVDETILATVTQPTRVELPEDMVDEEAEGAEAEAVPSGEEAPESASESPAEPGGDAAGDQGTVSG